MFARGQKIDRRYYGKDVPNFMELPNLIDIQIQSYNKFLNKEKKTDETEIEGLESVFHTTFPIESTNEDMALQYLSYSLDYDSIKFSEIECKQKGLTYSVPLKAEIDLFFKETKEIRRKNIYMGDIPLMTERGTFIINGAERVVVSQIHRSPGVIFSHEKGVYSSRIIPYRGTWLEFEIDQKKELIYAKLDSKKRILGTIFLRALGYDTREKIIDLFYKTKTAKISPDRTEYEELIGQVLARDVYVKGEDGEKRKMHQAGEKIHPHNIDDLIQNDVKKITIIDFKGKDSLDSQIIINCFEREEIKYTPDPAVNDEPTVEDALNAVYSVIRPGDPITYENAKEDLHNMFFTARRYDIGKVGRYKLNKKFDYSDDVKGTTLIEEDIFKTMKFLIKVYIGEESIDDIDHLGNRRIRSVGEIMTDVLKKAFSRMERIARDRMSSKEMDTIKPQDLISIKPIVAAIKEFFGASQLSQFMDQVNPLAELTHKRRLNALGPGGLSRDRAGFEVREVHYTHYGRMCPIETPEGPNIGLIVSMANYARVNEYGFLEAPYVKVVNGVATREIEYLSAMDEDKYFIGQVSSAIGKDGKINTDQVSCRKLGDYTSISPKDIQYMDVSPKQIISVSASLIPFLEHDDANRALMGSNMQRQAVPLVFPEPPRVGTGMEKKCAYDSGVLVKAKRSGKVEFVSSDTIIIAPEKGKNKEDKDEYTLLKYQRTNQETCYHQRPIVNVGDTVKAGQPIADGPATYNGELALGRNILVGFVPWNGYNYEDAILISRRVVKEDMFTSIHIKELSTDVRETKLGAEKMTCDIPNKSEKSLDDLDSEGIIRIGSKVKPGDILVGKVTPKSESDTTPEFKLLNSIFGEKAKEVRDTSLRVPHGTEGTVIDVQRLKRDQGDDLSPGVDEVVKVLIATKRKLREGDKMAGRHGNKGLVARILPEEDMPYMEDGTPLDICLNPLGVPSRMNIGQILESELGLAGLKLNEWYESPVFESPSMEQIEAKLKEAGYPTSSKVKLRDGLTGRLFENEVFVGVIYFLKLAHLVDDKMHARSTGPYSLVTQQPLGGKAQFGGQRLGEMEVWALEAYGAANTLQELITIKSDDMHGRSKIYESIVKGEPSSSAGIPESFNVLVQELRGLALDFTIYDAKGQQIPLTERDEELIKREKTSTNF
ncbi:DNA-directed RNA polymerase subunit beta [Treponema denticola]|uniref:DNA-directed RNA polymerase subunit beta n=1 Tax=Treponema denticola OTK TaxID=999434 RepID=A0A0F6MQU4_TREDN|nr:MULTISPECIES: DNA-directed RNA polymerase subunit beta [Treponema]EGC78039.1 DNA-directed RNA polymerase subunit beta [Treponema denticola F0402]EMB23689.1 DNA-directed RNA polymerase subunit beta [Treponema denticola OTK]EMB42092.1 DNA-directed RNA polymerase subunit beta [Treponema denticola ATCC 33520]EMB44080.1 DNA-directed RNA polymerase subunit beta [Treponema denticola AL-2]EMB47585.1 DNA-directed RNA polymerase subunit beta [Treponema denticola ASLM]